MLEELISAIVAGTVILLFFGVNHWYSTIAEKKERGVI
jgi:ABC-type sulfate transport system permease subunit